MSEWFHIDDKCPLDENRIDVRIRLIDGSEVNCWAQSDGDFYWNGGGQEIFIPTDVVTHWMPIT